MSRQEQYKKKERKRFSCGGRGGRAPLLSLAPGIVKRPVDVNGKFT
jgi:hypothetical protein